MELYEEWNCSEKPDCCDVAAKENDLLLKYGGLFFLIQRENDNNNVVCFRYEESSFSFLHSILFLRIFLLNKGILYIKVIGNTKRYFFLKKLEKKLGPEGYSVLQDLSEKDRNVFLVKLADFQEGAKWKKQSQI